MSDGSNVAVKALVRINGVVLPGMFFAPDTDEQRAELFAIEAIDEPNAAEFLMLGQTQVFALSELTASLEIGEMA